MFNANVYLELKYIALYLVLSFEDEISIFFSLIGYAFAPAALRD
ncbi:hypothetical protein Krac_3060 [Ktedonobacter racemifer DSM 44963]|uniref:Uncharacterized protein n=1 Tax=Ktedonobacter racemifer DSM 44963 TaxID=485913 RepID=D6U0C8_KTERA|nr:hypothetical protein Krac_3060 [Ktedonobacter racemifer DSM 44963]